MGRTGKTKYHYCVGCMEELACCDDPDCDKDNERAGESVLSEMSEFYKNTKSYR